MATTLRFRRHQDFHRRPQRPGLPGRRDDPGGGGQPGILQRPQPARRVSRQCPFGVFDRHNFTHYADSRFGALLVTNSFGLVGGRETETDDDYRFRLNLKIQSSAGANEAALRFALLQIPGIQDLVFERQAGAFIVYVYGISPDVSPASSERPGPNQR